MGQARPAGRGRPAAGSRWWRCGTRCTDRGSASAPASPARGSTRSRRRRSRPRTACRHRSGTAARSRARPATAGSVWPVRSSRATRHTGTGFAPDSETNSKSRANTDWKGSSGHAVTTLAWVVAVPGCIPVPAEGAYHPTIRLRATDRQSGFVVGYANISTIPDALRRTAGGSPPTHPRRADAPRPPAPRTCGTGPRAGIAASSAPTRRPARASRPGSR